MAGVPYLTVKQTFEAASQAKCLTWTMSRSYSASSRCVLKAGARVCFKQLQACMQSGTRAQDAARRTEVQLHDNTRH